MRTRVCGVPWPSGPVTAVLSVMAVLVSAVVTAWWGPGSARAADGGDGARSWPVTGGAGKPRPVVLRGWDPPPVPWAAGHRGVDLGTAPGAEVRAVGAGRVAFTGTVAGRGVVTVTLQGTGAPPLRVTYQPVRAEVTTGETVRAGETLGRVEEDGFHCARPCLHWGLLRGDTYLDPLSALPPWMLRTGTFRLLPHVGVPPLREGT